MPSTANFKSKLYAHASRASKPRRAFPASKAVPPGGVNDATAASALVEAHDDADASPLLPSTGRGLSDVPDRGALLDPEAVVMMIFPGLDPAKLPGKLKWIRENVPFKVPLGHKTVGWFEADVRWWLEDRRNGKPGSMPQRRRPGQSGKKAATERAAHVKTRRRVRGKDQPRPAKKRRAAR